MRILITRPEPGNRQTAERLQALGYDPVLMPVLHFAVTHHALPEPAEFAAIALTSANAVKALDERGNLPGLQHLPAFAVGGATASAARAGGFRNVIDASGGVGELADTILASGLSGPLLYPAARHRAGDLELLLARGGQKAQTIAVYEMFAAKPAELAIPRGPFAAALFYSRRTTEAFLTLNMEPMPALCLCLSDGVAAPLRNRAISNVHVTTAPNEDAMVKLLLSMVPIGSTA